MNGANFRSSAIFFFHHDNSYEGGMSQNRGEVIEGSLRRN